MLGLYYAGQPYPGQSGIVTTVTLVVQNATHSHTADAPSLTQAHLLVVADALQAQTLDAVSVS